MTQADRDRLVTLKKAKKKVITQGEAAEELGVSTRQVRRLLCGLKKRGDKARRACVSPPSEIRTGYSSIGLLASIARLGFTGTRRLTRTPPKPGEKGTFLFCPEGDISTTLP